MRQGRSCSDPYDRFESASATAKFANGILQFVSYCLFGHSFGHHGLYRNERSFRDGNRAFDRLNLERVFSFSQSLNNPATRAQTGPLGLLLQNLPLCQCHRLRFDAYRGDKIGCEPGSAGFNHRGGCVSNEDRQVRTLLLQLLFISRIAQNGDGSVLCE